MASASPITFLVQVYTLHCNSSPHGCVCVCVKRASILSLPLADGYAHPIRLFVCVQRASNLSLTLADRYAHPIWLFLCVCAESIHSVLATGRRIRSPHMAVSVCVQRSSILSLPLADGYAHPIWLFLCVCRDHPFCPCLWQTDMLTPWLFVCVQRESILSLPLADGYAHPIWLFLCVCRDHPFCPCPWQTGTVGEGGRLLNQMSQNKVGKKGFSSFGARGCGRCRRRCGRGFPFFCV